MNSQVNVRMPEDLLSKSQKMSKKLGFGSVQEFIREIVRERVYEKETLTKREYALVKNILNNTNNRGTEEELFKVLNE